LVPTVVKAKEGIIRFIPVKPLPKVTVSEIFPLTTKEYKAVTFVGKEGKVPTFSLVAKGKGPILERIPSTDIIRLKKGVVVKLKPFKKGVSPLIPKEPSEIILYPKIKKIKVGEELPYEIFKEKIKIKEVTLTGKVRMEKIFEQPREMKGIIRVWKEPKKIPFEIIPEKTPFAEELIKKVKETKKFIKPSKIYKWMEVPKPETVKVIPPVIQVQKEIPKIIKKAAELPKPVSKLIVTKPEMIKLKPAVKIDSVLAGAVVKIPKVKEQERLIVKERPKLIEIPRLVEVPRLVETPRLVEVPRLVETPRLVEVQKISPIQKIGLITKPIETQIIISKPPIPPRRRRPPVTPTPTPPPKLLFKIPKKRKRIVIKKPKPKEMFQPYVKRYGKWVAVSKPTPSLAEAQKKGLKKVRKTLAASLIIRKPKTGELVFFKEPSPSFRRGKDKWILVEKAPYRLKTPTEVAEIIRARKGIKFIS
ncbi:MAG: hypothetical protein ACOC5T_07980, partial [Elusimicrobiota bacterium]